MTSVVRKRTGLAAVVMLLVSSTAVLAADVTLRMRGGTFEIKGSLQSYNTKSYIISVPGVGILTLDAARYECVGPNCPGRPADAPLPALAPSSTPPPTTWIGGSGVGTEFMPRLVRAYAASIGATTTMTVGSDPRNLEMRIVAGDGRLIGQVNANRLGVTPGFLAMAKGEADAVWTGRRVLPEEEQMMAAAGVGSMRQPGNEHVWALDGLVVLVAKTNPVDALSLDEISRIFAGEVKDWGELGHPPGRINVYAPTAEAGAWSGFEALVLTGYGRKVTPAATRVLHSTEWSDRVAEDRHGIGLSILAMVRRAKAINITTACGIIVPPTVFNIKTEEYPLTRRMFFYTAGAPKNPLARALLAFAMSPRLQPVLKEAQFVDQEPEVLPFQSHSARIAAAINVPQEKSDAGLLRRLVQDLQPLQRVSFTFRFASGTNVLDNRALDDVRRLGTMMGRPDMSGKPLILAGFSDAVGAFTNNVLLAQNRIRTVRTALQQSGPVVSSPLLQERSYGPLAPVACNDTEQGRALNRRVEVWVR